MDMLRKGVCAGALVLVSLAVLPARQQGAVDPAMFAGLRWRPIGPMRPAAALPRMV